MRQVCNLQNEMNQNFSVTRGKTKVVYTRLPENGSYKKSGVSFTQISNIMWDDDNLSCRAKGLYGIIQRHITIPSVTLYVKYLMMKSQMKKVDFTKSWDELKDNGYLKQYRIRTRSGFIYEYELLSEPDLITPATQNIGLSGEIIPIKDKHNENSNLVF